ncbi:hypothetical protein [Acidovorax sp.]|uniref:hypothetical protein n=1 Tax=Acidovorax sp. TaxID=1872122 RepID=UPI002ACEAB7D|nr:hypothetical protein [Acidovorax sp.]MDZ7862780.1 hypothetical protein [Acidovorax sp.]
MFALPLTASLPSTLASHVFGRFAASSTPHMAVQSPAAAASALRADVATDFEDEEEFDLAQRVREVGEW